MGEVRASSTVSNPLKPGGPILELDAGVDTGAVMLLPGRDIAERLELPIISKALITLADDSRQEMEKAGPVLLTLGDRSDYFSCLVGSLGCEPLLG